jgi:hypothetical protein
MNLYKNYEILELKNFVVLINRAELICRCRLMYSKFFIYRVIICTIPLILMDIALICSMITGGYEGNLKATILAVIVLHIVLYILSRKQVKLLMQAFKQNGFKEINNVFNMKYVFIIVFFIILIAIKLMRY